MHNFKLYYYDKLLIVILQFYKFINNKNKEVILYVLDKNKIKAIYCNKLILLHTSQICQSADFDYGVSYWWMWKDKAYKFNTYGIL